MTRRRLLRSSYGQPLIQQAAAVEGPYGGVGLVQHSIPLANIYLSTGNGTFDANITGGKNYADSTVKLSPTGSVVDYFTPFNQSTFAAMISISAPLAL